MEDLEIVRILNKYNPWWNNKPIPPSKINNFQRSDFYFIKKELNRREIVSIIGPRRVGKTILIHQIIDYLLNNNVNAKRIFYLSVDEFELDKVKLNNVLEIYSKYIIQKPLDSLEETHYFFLDEIQEIPDWEKILKNWQDYGYNLKFIISGSSSIWISKGSEESLLGRIKTSVILPLKFSEVLRYKNIIPDDFFKKRLNIKENLVKSMEKNDVNLFYNGLQEFIGGISGKRNDIEIELGRYIIVGGYPEFLDENDYNRISSSIRDKIKLIFFKDIVRYFRIRNPSILEDLFKLLAKNSGSLFNLAGTAKTLDIERPTLRDYLKYLTKAYLIKSSEFYSESRSKRIRKQNKVYVLDAGIRNALVDYLDETLLNDATELGIVTEGIIFDHLVRLKYNLQPGPDPEVFYCREKKEIDFILNVKRKIIPIEAKYRSKVPSDTLKSIEDYIEKNNCPFGIIITKDEFKLENKIIRIPLWVFLLMV